MNIWLKILEAFLIGLLNYGLIIGIVCLLIYPRLRRIEKAIQEIRVIVNVEVKERDKDA